MQNNFPKISLFLSAIFFGVLLLVFIYFYGEISNNKKESRQRETEWQTEALKRNEIKTLDDSIKMIEQERAQLETHFAQSSDIVPFLDTLEALASRANTQAEIVSVDILKDRTGLMVGMKTAGTFGDFYKFLTLLENSPYELEFVSMDIHKGTGLEVESKNAGLPKLPRWDGSLKVKLLSFIQ